MWMLIDVLLFYLGPDSQISPTIRAGWWWQNIKNTINWKFCMVWPRLVHDYPTLYSVYSTHIQTQWNDGALSVEKEYTCYLWSQVQFFHCLHWRCNKTVIQDGKIPLLQWFFFFNLSVSLSIHQPCSSWSRSGSFWEFTGQTGHKTIHIALCLTQDLLLLVLSVKRPKRGTQEGCHQMQRPLYLAPLDAEEWWLNT